MNREDARVLGKRIGHIQSGIGKARQLYHLATGANLQGDADHAARARDDAFDILTRQVSELTEIVELLLDASPAVVVPRAAGAQPTPMQALDTVLASLERWCRGTPPIQVHEFASARAVLLKEVAPALEDTGTFPQHPKRPYPEELESLFWKFDALHKAHYRDADATLPGPLSERDAFKRVMAEMVEALRP